MVIFQNEYEVREYLDLIGFFGMIICILIDLLSNLFVCLSSLIKILASCCEEKKNKIIKFRKYKVLTNKNNNHLRKNQRRNVKNNQINTNISANNMMRNSIPDPNNFTNSASNF